MGAGDCSTLLVCEFFVFFVVTMVGIDNLDCISTEIDGLLTVPFVRSLAFLSCA